MAHHDDISTDPVTLSRFLLTGDTSHDMELVQLMNSLALACKSISLSVRKAGIAGLYGLQGASNSSGDDQKKLDVISNDVMIRALTYSKSLSVIVSEEEEDPIIVAEHLAGKYCVVTDPLDGSSNIDCNISTGTIFGIYEKPSTSPGCVEDVLRPGTELRAAGYCMYGSSTQLVLTTGNGVNIFTLDPSIGEFILTDSNVKIPSKPKTIYSINEGNSVYWYPPVTQFVNYCKELKPTPYSSRYVGSMVSDVHRTILYGGVFLYPADTKSPEGKLRLLYEGNPMSMIVEQAGGISSSGKERILDIIPKKIHQRCPIILGCKRDVEMVLKMHDDYYKSL
jgi:fructose-1,6-bisphosphatase I